jgi:hypothetical protein
MLKEQYYFLFIYLEAKDNCSNTPSSFCTYGITLMREKLNSKLSCMALSPLPKKGMYIL